MSWGQRVDVKGTGQTLQKQTGHQTVQRAQHAAAGDLSDSHTWSHKAINTNVQMQMQRRHTNMSAQRHTQGHAGRLPEPLGAGGTLSTLSPRLSFLCVAFSLLYLSHSIILCLQRHFLWWVFTETLKTGNVIAAGQLLQGLRVTGETLSGWKRGYDDERDDSASAGWPPHDLESDVDAVTRVWADVRS